ncbi:MAG TPA: hypothetical protein VKT78_08745, partial [Fimbriimonadaceae bacterium]|nr:hypothetical protein [Fimbriimonadaceae bacterium]
TIEGWAGGGNGRGGAVKLWSNRSTYIQPPSGWIPSVGPVLIPSNMRAGIARPDATQFPLSAPVAWPESGGRIAIRANADSVSGSAAIHAFYGDANYLLNAAAYDANVMVCTPLTAGPDGSLYFGYTVEGANPLNLVGGLAVVRPNGLGTFITAAAMAGGDAGITQPQYNCAPALSADGQLVYIAVSAGYSGRGYLCAVNTRTMLPKYHVALQDPLNGSPATVTSDSTSSPLIAPDGSVLFGVLENSLGTNNFRGYMLHFSYDLVTSYTPGGFGWDNTGSIIPSSFVASYKGQSPWLLLCKYNNYAGAGSGDGVNRIAVLDPDVETSNTNPTGGFVNNVNIMGVVQGLVGQTPDPNNIATFHHAVKEWCVNSIAVDMINKSAICNSEDGSVYVWNLNNNTITSKLALTAGIGEAYTSTVIGVNGWVYAISNARLYGCQ